MCINVGIHTVVNLFIYLSDHVCDYSILYLLSRNTYLAMHGWITGQLAVSGGELAASGGLRLFRSPSNRCNFAAGFRRDTQVSDT